MSLLTAHTRNAIINGSKVPKVREAIKEAINTAEIFCDDLTATSLSVYPAESYIYYLDLK